MGPLGRKALSKINESNYSDLPHRQKIENTSCRCLKQWIIQKVQIPRLDIVKFSWISSCRDFELGFCIYFWQHRCIVVKLWITAGFVKTLWSNKPYFRIFGSIKSSAKPFNLKNCYVNKNFLFKFPVLDASVWNWFSRVQKLFHNKFFYKWKMQLSSTFLRKAFHCSSKRISRRQFAVSAITCVSTKWVRKKYYYPSRIDTLTNATTLALTPKENEPQMWFVTKENCVLFWGLVISHNFSANRLKSQLFTALNLIGWFTHPLPYLSVNHTMTSSLAAMLDFQSNCYSKWFTLLVGLFCDRCDDTKPC